MTAANSFVQDGKNLDYINSGATAIGYLDVVAGTDRIFIAAESIAPGELGSVYSEGVFEFPAKADDVFTFGQKLYYDATNGYITSLATDHIYAGYATEAKAATVTTVNLKLSES